MTNSNEDLFQQFKDFLNTSFGLNLQNTIFLLQDSMFSSNNEYLLQQINKLQLMHSTNISKLIEQCITVVQNHEHTVDEAIHKVHGAVVNNTNHLNLLVQQLQTVTQSIQTLQNKILNDSSLFRNNFHNLTVLLDSHLNQVQASDQVIAQDFQTVLSGITNNTQNTESTIATMKGIVNTLTNIENITTEVKESAASTTATLQLLNTQHIVEWDKVTSCQDIIGTYPDSPSGYYTINNTLLFCEMGELCNNTGGGWTRLAYLDMTNPFSSCPSGFYTYKSSGFRACGRPSMGSGCTSVIFPSHDLNYSQVCGKVIGYQYGSTEGAHSTDIDTPYIDGISITRGSPRQHVWSLISGHYESHSKVSWNCPCNSPPGDSTPSFVGNDYFCESGNSGSLTVCIICK